MRLLGRAVRRVRRLPRRWRRVLRSTVVLTELAAAARAERVARPQAALRLLADAGRRNPADAQVLRARVRLMVRTGQLGQAAAHSARLMTLAPSPANAALHRSVQGRWTETDPAWRPVVPGPAPVEPGLDGRVLYLAKESMPHLNNGYCTRTHETLLAVRGSGWQPVAVTLPGFPAQGHEGVPAAASSVVDGIEYHHLMPGASSALGALPWEDFVQLSTAAFAREVLRVRPQVLHAGSGHRGFDIGLPGAALARWAKLPWIYEVRSFFEGTWTADRRFAESAQYYHRRFATETRAMQQADAVVTLSGPMRAEIVRAHGIDPQRVFVIGNAVDLDRFAPVPRDQALRQRLGLGSSYVLGYISNLDHYREGQEVLLRAAARLRAGGHDVAVLLVGEGRRRTELTELAAQLGLAGHCVFTGNVPFQQVAEYYAQIDLFVVPRVDERAGRLVSPMKPFEAMAMGVPVLVSDLPALVEIAAADTAHPRALVFAAGDDASLAAVVQRVLAAPELAAAVASTAGQWVRAERTWAANGDRFVEVYQFAAEQHRRRSASC